MPCHAPARPDFDLPEDLCAFRFGVTCAETVILIEDELHHLYSQPHNLESLPYFFLLFVIFSLLISPLSVSSLPQFMNILGGYQ